MLTADITGQVRDAISKEEIKIEKDDYVKPGQRVKQEKVEPKLEEQVENKDVKAKLEQQSTGLKFGKSVNRSRTTKITREELANVLKPNAPMPGESADGFSLPQPNVPKAFDPLTSLAPPNQGPKTSPRSSKSQNPIARKSRTRKPTKEEIVVDRNSPTTNVQLNPDPEVNSAQISRDLKPSFNPSNSSSVMRGKTIIIGFLISYDKDKNGEVYQIRKGRKLITSRPTDHGEYMLIEDETVSPLHAILRTTKDHKIQIMDQLSEYGTTIIRAGTNEEIEVAGGLETVENGDILRIGEINFSVVLLP